MIHDSMEVAKEPSLLEFAGVYHGVSPTDESAVGTGELRVTIDHTGISHAYATGLQVEEYDYPLAVARELSAAEIAAMAGEESIEGVRIFDIQGLSYLFYKVAEEPDAPRLFIIGGMGDILGPTVLFDSEQVAQGTHEKFIQALEKEYDLPGSVPRLHHQGVVPEE